MHTLDSNRHLGETKNPHVFADPDMIANLQAFGKRGSARMSKALPSTAARRDQNRSSRKRSDPRGKSFACYHDHVR